MARATRKRPSSNPSGADEARPPAVESDRALVQKLTEWYDQNRRTLPWREKVEPYAIWVSEVMLQQTQVASVVAYYQRWMQHFPTVERLAAASLDEVLSLWQGLGYYSRARNLHRSAQLIVTRYGGVIPADPFQLSQLPGIGRYTAGAIASIAFDRPEPAVDGNVERVITRFRALRGDPKTGNTAKQIERLAAEWVRYDSPRRVNQALMELGALTCIAETPRCFTCPLLSHCLAHRHDLAGKLPETRPRPKPHPRYVVLLVSRNDETVLVVRQPESEQHWATLFTLPFAEYDTSGKDVSAAQRLLAKLDPNATLQRPTPVTRLTYPITRFRFHASVFEVTTIRLARVNKLQGRYATNAQLVELAMPAPHRRVLRTLLGGPGAA